MINLSKLFRAVLLLSICLFISCSVDPILHKNAYTVAFIPSQCAPSHSEELGLKAPNGEYYLVIEGADLMKDFQEGDKVEVELSLSESGWSVCLACNCPAPDNGAILKSIRKL